MSSEHVATYNALVKEAEALGQSDYKPVKKFASSVVAEKRIRELGETLEALRSQGSTNERDAPEEIQNDIQDAQEALKEKEETAKSAPRVAKKKVAKKKVAKKTKSAPIAKKKVAANEKDLTPAERALDVRPGTKKAILLAYLIEHKKEKLTRTKMIGAVYGKPESDYINPFSSCMAGLMKTMKAKKWGSLTSEKVQGGKEVNFVFDAKNNGS